MFKKVLKRIKNFIVDCWFIHVLALLWLTPVTVIYISCNNLELSIVVKILMNLVVFLVGMVEGFCIWCEIDND